MQNTLFCSNQKFPGTQRQYTRQMVSIDEFLRRREEGGGVLGEQVPPVPGEEPLPAGSGTLEGNTSVVCWASPDT